MLESIITSRARIRLLLKFFINPHVKAYLREISKEFGRSSNAVRVELNRLVDAKLLKISKRGRNKYYSANIDHPLFPEIHSISKKMMGLNRIYEWLSDIGNLEAAYITGDYARGTDSGIIDLLLVGELESGRIYEIIAKTESLINRRIRPFLLTRREFEKMSKSFREGETLLLWGSDSGMKGDETCGLAAKVVSTEGGLPNEETRGVDSEMMRTLDSGLLIDRNPIEIRINEVEEDV